MTTLNYFQYAAVIMLLAVSACSKVTIIHETDKNLTLMYDPFVDTIEGEIQNKANLLCLKNNKKAVFVGEDSVNSFTHKYARFECRVPQ